MTNYISGRSSPRNRPLPATPDQSQSRYININKKILYHKYDIKSEFHIQFALTFSAMNTLKSIPWLAFFI